MNEQHLNGLQLNFSNTATDLRCWLLRAGY